MMGAIAPSVEDGIEANFHSSRDYSSIDFCKQVSTKSPVNTGKTFAVKLRSLIVG